MLPFLRILPVGGVLLAISILLLALIPPSGMHPPSAPRAIAERGPLIDRNDHPEWRQFLIHAALRRAGELERLRELPDTPMRVEPMIVQPEPLVRSDAGQTEAPPQPDPQQAPQVAGLPIDRIDAEPDPEDITGSIVGAPGATMPIDIGETSSTELPVIPVEERAPVIITPERLKPLHESRRPLPRKRRAKAAPRPQAEAPFNLFEVLFGKNPNQLPPAAARSDIH